VAKPQKLPSGAWRVQWKDAAGKRRGGTFATEAAARAELRRKQVETDDIRAGRTRARSDQTVREASVTWLADRPASRFRDNEKDLRMHILPFMGDRLLPEVTPDLVQKFIRHLEKKKTAKHGEKNLDGHTLRPATIQNVLITLRKMMNDLDYHTRIKFQVPIADFAWLRTQAEVATFLDACRPPWFRMAAELAVYAGLRKGEIAGLVWAAIDLDRGIIRVDRSYEGPTKSKHQRHVPLAPELATILKRWRLRHGGRLVVTVDGEPITEKTAMAERARRACKRAGVTSIKFHELRDTYASHLAERVSLPIVGAVLGHADTKTTARYAHIDVEGLARDPRLHLTFARPEASIVPLHAHQDRQTGGSLPGDDLDHRRSDSRCSSSEGRARPGRQALR
jgi:integrase